MGVKVKIIGVGGFIKTDGSDIPRPVYTDAVISVDEKLAEQLVADKVAVYLDQANEPEPPAEFDLAAASDEEVSTFIASSTIDEVLAAVGEDADKAARALTAEEARGDQTRSTLVEKLTALVGD